MTTTKGLTEPEMGNGHGARSCLRQSGRKEAMKKSTSLCGHYVMRVQIQLRGGEGFKGEILVLKPSWFVLCCEEEKKQDHLFFICY